MIKNILKRLRRRLILVIIVILVVFGLIIYSIFIKDNEPEYILEKVSYGTVIKEVSETGAIKISEETNLGFKNAGRIDEIYVKVGDKIVVGQAIARLDTSQLYIELAEAQAALEVAQADYDKLLAGSSSEEIKIAETEVLEAQIVLDNAEQSLEDVKADVEEDLDQAYEDAVDALDDAYLKIYNAFNLVSDIQRTYFNSGDQQGVSVRENKSVIADVLGKIDLYIDQAKVNYEHEKIDTALSKTRQSLSDVAHSLEIIRNMAESAAYYNTVSSADKTSLDNHKSYINTEASDIVTARQAISTIKITNKTNINTAEANIVSAEASLQKAQDQLALKRSGPTKENINLYLAKIKQAEAKVSLLQDKVQEAVLKSPDKGQITKVNNRKGETVQATDSVISFLPLGPFQIEVDIYEEDIINVKVDNIVRISLPSFPDEIFDGRVVSIDPSEKMINGVVYYEVNISLDSRKEGIKPGMTADVIIEVDRRENVLIVSKQALRKINGEKTVRAFKDGEAEERKIEVGLEGDEYIEVISGLSEGEQIILGEKP